MPLLELSDFGYPAGWDPGTDARVRARDCCEALEAGAILLLQAQPFDLAEEDRAFLLSQRQSDSLYHKNIAYRPLSDRLSGFSSDRPDEAERLHRLMRDYSAQVTATLAQILAPYANRWTLDYASFRPLEEKGRNLPVHKRNDLLHVDAFPTRPTHGARILRVFTNLNPDEPRVWLTGGPFDAVARRYAEEAGLARFAAARPELFVRLQRAIPALRSLLRHVAIDRSPYDRFMLAFHDYLKERTEYQRVDDKLRTEFPPGATWVVFTDAVPHAALSGQFALEQTFIVPIDAMVTPAKSPLRILEVLAARPLA